MFEFKAPRRSGRPLTFTEKVRSAAVETSLGGAAVLFAFVLRNYVDHRTEVARRAALQRIRAARRVDWRGPGGDTW